MKAVLLKVKKAEPRLLDLTAAAAHTYHNMRFFFFGFFL